MSEMNTLGAAPNEPLPNILMPLPDRDVDPTESAIPWRACTSRGWRVTFSTEHGNVAEADQNKLNGPLPGLLSASENAKMAYREMARDNDYQHPIPYAEINPDQYVALLLPGGDSPGMRQYLESPLLQTSVLEIWQRGKLIGAICHGVLVLARTINPRTGRSILYGKKVTAVPRSLDRLAYLVDSWLLKRGYIMYSSCVAEEVRSCLAHPEDFSKGPGVLTPYVVSDGNLITSRWYLDAELFAETFANALERHLSLTEGMTAEA